MITRRRLLQPALAGVGLALTGSAARAGGQLEEPLADSIRTALSAAVAGGPPPELHFPELEPRLAYLRWLGANSERLRRRKPDFQTRIEFLQTVWYETRRAGPWGRRGKLPTPGATRSRHRAGTAAGRHHPPRIRLRLGVAQAQREGADVVCLSIEEGIEFALTDPVNPPFPGNPIILQIVLDHIEQPIVR